jgi:hypothetical protein
MPLAVAVEVAAGVEARTICPLPVEAVDGDEDGVALAPASSE